MSKMRPWRSRQQYWQQRTHRWLVIVGILLALVFWLPTPVSAEPIEAPTDRTLALTAAASSKAVPHSFVANAVEKVGAAVVRIDTERTIIRPAVDPFMGDPFLRDFFGQGNFPQGPQEDRLRGQGSGFIIEQSGTLLTNAHVVSNADTVTVTLTDGRTFDGSVAGVDEVSDLAVVKLNNVDNPLPIAPLGDSVQVKVGDWAIAVGNPVGLDNTVTLGIVSTLHRTSAEVGMPSKRLEFIQTDAAINPGNSGGPLLNQQGEVIGINTAIRTDAEGIGFAIPIDKAKEIKDRLVRGEKIHHPYVGIQMTALTPELAHENNQDPNSPTLLPELAGVLVVQVLPDTPAAKAGVRWGDVIVDVDGQSVTDAGELQSIVEGSRVGQSLRLTIKRGDRTQTITVQTGELQTAT